MQSTRLFAPASILFKGIRAAPITTTSQRFFSLTTACQNEETKTPEAAVEQAVEAEAVVEEEVEPINLSRRRRRFHEWAHGSGAKYSRPAKGTTNYLGTSNPFPNNPLFQPRPPLSDVRRQEIYNAFESDPETWSVRKLATKYGVSLKRIEAILTLKASEKEMEMNGIPLQKKFAKGMEQLMGVDKTVELLKEPLIDIFPSVGKPKFKTLKEDATFAPEDAAKVLGRIPFKDLERRVIESKQAEYTLPTPKNITSASETTKRTKFVIVDTSA
ncbi:hypothetical protein INT47_009036 [Mucor saturninus]|uniref:Eukaryotic mitochondrial regulator protein-domain-containing protein n=1 Tax=Mucor saturninus TaxID=64648 RepID=A0A8H7RMQ3_9FUNG|nr:hypothetical protein INT47_009036 [Mucor saturninus]